MKLIHEVFLPFFLPFVPFCVNDRFDTVSLVDLLLSPGYWAIVRDLSPK